MASLTFAPSSATFDIAQGGSALFNVLSASYSLPSVASGIPLIFSIPEDGIVIVELQNVASTNNYFFNRPQTDPSGQYRGGYVQNTNAVGQPQSINPVFLISVSDYVRPNPYIVTVTENVPNGNSGTLTINVTGTNGVNLGTRTLFSPSGVALATLKNPA